MLGLLAVYPILAQSSTGKPQSAFLWVIKMNIPMKYEDVAAQLETERARVTDYIAQRAQTELLLEATLGREAALREELAALRESYEAMRDRKNSIVDLQQRLTVAEKREGELEGLFRDQATKVGLVISSLEFDERLRGSNPERSTLDFPHAIRILSQVKDALKPAAEVAAYCTHPPGCKQCSWCGFKAESKLAAEGEGS